ncbi:MAG: metallophosphoesterase [Candidatus Falkowbacteria bacterium]
MKIAIISDTHDNIPNLEKALAWMKQNNIKQLICCGDVCNSETLKYLAESFKNKIHLVYGNMELYEQNEAKQYDNINFLGRYGIVSINNKQIGICHEPWFVDKILEQDKYDIIFYGHTHKPWDEMVKKIRMLNPGTLAGMFYKATFAVWDTENNNFELKVLEEM